MQRRRLQRVFLCCVTLTSQRCVYSFISRIRHPTPIFLSGLNLPTTTTAGTARKLPEITKMSTLAQRSEEGFLLLPRLSSELNRHPVFVYGSLLSGLDNHHVMIQSKASFVNDGRTEGSFYLTGLQSDLYPYLSRIPLVEGQSKSQITGELYAVSTDVIVQLDEFEGDEYERTEIAVENLSPETGEGSGEGEVVLAYVYLLVSADKIAAERPDLSSLSDNRYPLVPVLGGCWRSHLRERNQQKRF